MKRSSLILTIFVLVAILAGLLIFAVPGEPVPSDPTLQTPPTTAAPTDPSTAPPTTTPTAPPTTAPTEPPVIKETTATLGATGDILMHVPVIDTGRNPSSGDYDFSSIFTYFSDYISGLDYAAANLETTLCGLDYGYAYAGYPNFNCPDAIASSMKAAGFDMMLTANNHSYDTHEPGYFRTQKVLREMGFDHLGTREKLEDNNYLVRDLNGIQVGMICYTYNDGIYDDGSINLNYNHPSLLASQLINSFNQWALDDFYAKLEGELAAMEAAGAEATVLFIHWGEEYELVENSVQNKIAQAVCDMGVDVIIGGHPHVVQPVELLTSTTDETHKTVCLYSMGNAVSNQRLGNLSSVSTAHTEDGVLFSVRFAKYSDGTVLVEGIEIIPTWVNMHWNDGPKKYQILPLDKKIADWKTAFNLTDGQLQKCNESYDRTMIQLGDGMDIANAYYAQHQAEVEALLGVTK